MSSFHPASILSFLWRIRGALALLLVSVLLLALSVRCNTLRATLAAEQTAHNATLHALRDAVHEGDRWKALTEDAYAKAAALSDYADACLKREAEARADFAARTTIMTNARPRPRTDAEAKEVIDDATRMAAAARLNRPW